MFCTKLKDKKGKEHTVLIVAKNVTINFEDGSRIISYESEGKVKVIFGNDKLKRSEYNLKTLKTIGLDCTTGETFIMDSILFEELEADICFSDEITENELVNNVPFFYYIAEESENWLASKSSRFILSNRNLYLPEYVNFKTGEENKKASKHRIKLSNLPAIMIKGTTLETDYLVGRNKWKEDSLEVVEGEVGCMIKCKNDLNEYFYIY